VRKPIHQTGPLDSREALWAAIRKLGRFTISQAQQETRLRKDTAREYIIGLEKAGFLAKDGEQPAIAGRTATIYKLVKDVGVEAPRVRKDGSIVEQGKAREQMWRTMGILKTFSAADLTISASTEKTLLKIKDVRSYITFLVKAGYLQVVQQSKGAIPARYRLLPARRTGPKPPMVQRVKQVFDPNLGKVVWPKESRT